MILQTRQQLEELKKGRSVSGFQYTWERIKDVVLLYMIRDMDHTNVQFDGKKFSVNIPAQTCVIGLDKSELYVDYDYVKDVVRDVQDEEEALTNNETYLLVRILDASKFENCKLGKISKTMWEGKCDNNRIALILIDESLSVEDIGKSKAWNYFYTTNGEQFGRYSLKSLYDMCKYHLNGSIESVVLPGIEGCLKQRQLNKVLDTVLSEG